MISDYWFNRANKFQADIEHIKFQLENDSSADKEKLKDIKNKLVDELMVCHEAIAKFGR